MPNPPLRHTRSIALPSLSLLSSLLPSPLPSPLLSRLPSLLAIALAAFLSTLPSVAFAQPDADGPSAGGLIYDAVLERPLSLVETVVGVGIAGVAYPLSLGSGRAERVLERCIKEPARNTFTRSLGDFSNRSGSKCSPVGFSWSVLRASLQVVERPLSFVFGRSPMSRESDEHRDEIEI
jgi:hypothetical protein